MQTVDHQGQMPTGGANIIVTSSGEVDGERARASKTRLISGAFADRDGRQSKCRRRTHRFAAESAFDNRRSGHRYFEKSRAKIVKHEICSKKKPIFFCREIGIFNLRSPLLGQQKQIQLVQVAPSSSQTAPQHHIMITTQTLPSQQADQQPLPQDVSHAAPLARNAPLRL